MKIQLRALSLYDAAGRRRAGGLKKNMQTNIDIII